MLLVLFNSMNLELLNWIKDGKYRIKIIEILSKRALLSSEIAEFLDINRSSMSRILRALKEKRLVETVSEGSRTVTYMLTDLGREIHKLLEESQDANRIT